MWERLGQEGSAERWFGELLGLCAKAIEAMGQRSYDLYPEKNLIVFKGVMSEAIQAEFAIGIKRRGEKFGQLLLPSALLIVEAKPTFPSMGVFSRFPESQKLEALNRWNATARVGKAFLREGDVFYSGVFLVTERTPFENTQRNVERGVSNAFALAKALETECFLHGDWKS